MRFAFRVRENEPRLTVRHLLLYVLVTALVMLVARRFFVSLYGTGPEAIPHAAAGRTDFGIGLFWWLTVSGCVISGIALAGVLLFVHHFIKHANGVLSHPGHALLVVIGFEALMTTGLTGYREWTDNIVEKGVGSLEVGIITAVGVLLAYIWCMWKWKQTRWRIFFAAAFVLIGLDCGVQMTESVDGQSVGRFPLSAMQGACVLWLVVIAAHEFFVGPKRDYFHWLGISLFVATYVITLGWKLWVYLL